MQAVLGSRAISRQLRAESQSGNSSQPLQKIVQSISPVSSRVQTKPMFRGVSQAWETAAAGLVIQPKLTIGEPNDKYEQEADQVAQKVAQQIHLSPASRISSGVTVQRQPQEDLQRKSESRLMGGPAAGMAASGELEVSIRQARGGGEPLPETVREPMEQAFGADFRGVRIHANAQADQLNRSISAKAFTTGQDVFMRQGSYQPNSRAGQELIAHELTHVVQQRGESAVQLTAQSQQQSLLEDFSATTAQEASIDHARICPTNHRLSSTAMTNPVIQRVAGEKVGYNPESIRKKGFEEAVRNLFSVARRLNALWKLQITKGNKEALGSLVDEAKKGSQVKNVYAEQLASVNLTSKWLQQIVEGDKQVGTILTAAKSLGVDTSEIASIEKQLEKLEGTLEVSVAENKILDKTWKESEGVAQPSVDILMEEKLFVKKTELDEAKKIHREIYQKLGKEAGENNEYVKDDFGNYTRRYAYMEKNYHQWMAYQEQGYLTGNTQDLIGSVTGTSAMKVDPTNFDQQQLTDNEEAVHRKYKSKDGDTNKLILAYLHQWQGSGPGQRGLSLTSTPTDDAVYGNKGEPFKSSDGVKFKVDLAAVKPENILINHYSHDGKTRQSLTEGRKDDADRRLGGESGGKYHYQYERSVIKNREVYLQYLTSAEVHSVVFHDEKLNEANTKSYLARKKAVIQNDKLKGELAVEKKKLGKAEKELTAAKNELSNLEKEGSPEGFLGPKQARYKRTKNKVSSQTKTVQDLTKAIQGKKAQIESEPSPDDKYGLAGWEAGKNYLDGYRQGLEDAEKLKGKNEKGKIEAIFEKVKKDYQESKKTNKDPKYTPYWQGYGAALKESNP
ncbi:MAG: hypothetical protein DCF15_13170 [Phormidesmis priestleyi]|uniref:eCIS core domain-containing protein n=1 Tax=Phormidesmis priestleyi TaxID=268141 RepID=A0A2W4X8R4_9CYAN|nr:MAG: hypothetical protein DCF15_13170 [Phormidesmis priestleyi]